MSGLQNYSLELKPEMYAFLEEMTRKYNLADVGKTVRCLVNYARAEQGKHGEIFDEIRCLDC